MVRFCWQLPRDAQAQIERANWFLFAKALSSGNTAPTAHPHTYSASIFQCDFHCRNCFPQTVLAHFSSSTLRSFKHVLQNEHWTFKISTMAAAVGFCGPLHRSLWMVRTRYFMECGEHHVVSVPAHRRLSIILVSAAAAAHSPSYAWSIMMMRRSNLNAEPRWVRPILHVNPETDSH